MLTTGDVAKLFDVSAQTVINWLNDKRIPYLRHGNGRRVIREQDVYEYILSRGISTDYLDSEIVEKILAVVEKFPKPVKEGLIQIDTEGQVFHNGILIAQNTELRKEIIDLMAHRGYYIK